MFWKAASDEAPQMSRVHLQHLMLPQINSIRQNSATGVKNDI